MLLQYIDQYRYCNIIWNHPGTRVRTVLEYVHVYVPVYSSSMQRTGTRVYRAIHVYAICTCINIPVRTVDRVLVACYSSVYSSTRVRTRVPSSIYLFYRYSDRYRYYYYGNCASNDPILEYRYTCTGIAIFYCGGMHACMFTCLPVAAAMWHAYIAIA